MRRLCWWAVPFSAAVFLSVCLLPEQVLIPAGILCVLGVFPSLLLQKNVRRRILRLALGLAFGFLWTGLYGLLFRAPARSLIQNDIQKYTLVVTDFPSATSRGASFSARLHLKDSPDPKVQLYAEADALELCPGDEVSCSIRFAASDFLRGEHVDYYQARGIYLLGYVQDAVTLERRPPSVSPRYWPQYAANALKSSIASIFPDDSSGFVTALITGDKRNLPTGLYAAFQRSGISHIIVVSGLHISFLAGIMSLLFGRRSRRAAAISILLMFFFAALAGNTPSALRAAFMSSLLLIAPLAGREPDKPTTLAAALFVLLLPCPYAAASVSLQLSFAAVAGIYLLTEELSARWLKALPKWDKPLGKLARRILTFLICNLAVTLGALLFTTPLAAFYFRSVSVMGPLTNLLTLWAVSGVFLAGLLAALLGLFFPPLGAALAWVTAWPARWVMFVARHIARLPYASLSLRSGYLVFWFAATYAILLIWVFARKHIRPAIPLSALLLTLSAVLVTQSWDAAAGTLTVAALDVGQGSSTLFYSKGHAVLVDCGGNSGDDPGDVAADYLQSLGASRLDALVLTHCHSDHAGGVPELLARVDVPLLILPDIDSEDPLREEILSLAENYDCKVVFLSHDTALAFGEAIMSLYAPLGDGGSNEEGLSVLCSAGDFNVLITGDMNSAVEHRLVKYKNLPDIEILMVGHHGAKSSTSEELLLAVTPETAVISSGYNSYGHPAPETLERLGAAGCGIYRTDQMGTVTFTLKGEYQP